MRIEGSEVCSQLKRNLISVSAFKTLSLEVSIRDGVLKMTVFHYVCKGGKLTIKV